jgi:hypothetical protein
VKIVPGTFQPATVTISSVDVGWITVKRLNLGPQSGRLFKAPHVRGIRTYRVYLSIDQAGDGYVDSHSNSVRVRYRR